MGEFNSKETTRNLIKWIKEWFAENGNGCNAVIGISGGKDSSIVAALCVAALGKDRVIGVLMPNGVQKDIGDAISLINHLGIKHTKINIGQAYNDILERTGNLFDFNENTYEEFSVSEQTKINLAPRLRMAALYAVSQSLNGRVLNTCNLSEDWIGFSTRFGDSVGDLSPLANLTATEVKLVGKELGLPDELIEKIPADGLTDKTDEDNFGFTYNTLDKYIRTGVCEDLEIKKRIDSLHERNLFKLQPMPTFKDVVFEN